MNKTIYIILLLVAFVVVSCERNEEKIELTSALNGEWEVVAYLGDTPIHDGALIVIESVFNGKSLEIINGNAPSWIGVSPR